MPISTIVGKSAAALVLMRLHAESPLPFIVDVGPGLGSYKRLMGPLLPGTRWIAVEVWAPYVSAYRLSSLYDRVYVADATCFDFSLLPPGGLAILGDVLEHIPRAEAIAMVSKIMNRMDYAILSVPAGPWPQEEMGGNWYEAHVESWSLDELRSAFRPWLAAFANNIFNSTQSLVSMFLANSDERRAKLTTQVSESLEPLGDEPSLLCCGLPHYPNLLDTAAVNQFISVIERHAGQSSRARK